MKPNWATKASYNFLFSFLCLKEKFAGFYQINHWRTQALLFSIFIFIFWK